jgi:uncharacterized membrane protein
MRVRLTALAIAAAALLAPGAAQSRAQDTLVIKVVSVSVKLTENDRPPKGTSKGDTIVFKDVLENAVAQFGKKKGAKVGTDTGTMTFQSAGSATFSGRAVLPGGTLTLRGSVRAVQGGGITIPVTGGTGRFAGAKGVLVVGPGKARTPNTYRLTIPVAPVA